MVSLIFALDASDAFGGKDDPWWIASGAGALGGVLLLLLAMISGQAYQLATAGALVGQYLVYMMFVVKSWRDSKSDATGSSGNLLE